MKLITPLLLLLILINFKSMDRLTLSVVTEEICNNAIDDDGDNLIDLNDPDCACQVIEPISLIPNPSFEDRSCCPDDRSQLGCASVWIQASEPTTDYIHTCGWLGWADFPPPLPFPDGQGIMGFRDGRVRRNNEAETNWKEYAGACLLSPLLADSTYRFEFDVGFVNNQLSPPINITFFGSSDCDSLPFGFGDAGFGCPTNGPGWVNLGATMVSGANGHRWVKATIEVTPERDINAIAIGPDCPAVDSPVSIYYFFDNLLLADVRQFDLRIVTENYPCQPNYTLQVPNNNAFTYQWYKNGVALVGEENAALIGLYGEGQYQVSIDDGSECRISAEFAYRIPVITQLANQSICPEASYSFGSQLLTQSGTYEETFNSYQGCDSMVTLDLNVLGMIGDTVEAKIFAGEIFILADSKFKNAGEHLITLPTELGCDSLVLLKLEYYKVYIPNVFSPNQDGINDFFQAYGPIGEIEMEEITIYNRWGAVVFRGPKWDGRHAGEIVNSGVYLYVAHLQMDDQKVRQFSGEVTVLR